MPGMRRREFVSAARRRGGGVAARGARAAAGELADHRYTRLTALRVEPIGLCSHAAATRTRLG